MDGVRLSAAEKGKRKAADGADADADVLTPPAAPSVSDPESAGEPPRPAGGDAAAKASWHAAAAAAAGAGLPRQPHLVPPSGTSEIEEAPPSPPPAASRPHPHPHPHLSELNAEEDAAAAGLALAAVTRLEGMMKQMEAALYRGLRDLVAQVQLRRREGEEGSNGDADEPEVAGAEQHEVGTAMREAVSGIKDRMLALRLQAEEMQALLEFWKPVVLVPAPQRNSSSKRKVEEMQAALEEFWKPVVRVPQRNSSMINWKRIVSLVALTSGSGLVPYISLWTLLPAVNNPTHIVGAICVLWILRSTYSCCQRFRTSRTMVSRHVPTLIYVCFWLLVLYVLYLILRPIHGTFAGLLGKYE